MLDDVVTGARNLYWDDDNKAAFLYDGDEWSSMETTATIAGKAAYVEEKGLGGMMFWALSNDAGARQVWWGLPMTCCARERAMPR